MVSRQHIVYLDVMKVSCLCLPSLKPLVGLQCPGEVGSMRNERSNSDFRSESGQHCWASATRSTFTCNTYINNAHKKHYT